MIIGTEVGNYYPAWWETGHRDKNGKPYARVIEVMPYTGTMGFFTKVLRLHAPYLKKGYLEMPVE